MIFLKDLLMEATKLRKHGSNSYRMTLSSDTFGQITKKGSKWYAEVRDTNAGHIIRFAGIWSSLKDAVDELESINPLDL
jgi:hypothetical protein